MRKITQEAAFHFDNCLPYSKSNTTVTVRGGIVELSLHGNIISWTQDGRQYFTMCGWPTPTTRERLQAAGISVGQRDHEQYYIHPETGEETLISPNKVYRIKEGGGIVN